MDESLRTQIENLDEELCVMFSRAQQKMLDLFGPEIYGSFYLQNTSRSVRQITYSEGNLLVHGVPFRDATVYQRIAAAHCLERLLDVLIEKQDKMLEDMKEALSALQEFVDAG